MELSFREALPSNVGELFSVRARTRENPISSEQLAEFGITPEVIAGQIASGRIREVKQFCHRSGNLDS